MPLLRARLVRLSLDDCGLVIVMIQFLVVTPSCAVITVVMVLLPTANAIDCEGVPDATGWPFTVIVAVASFAVGITCTDVSLLGTAELKLR